MPPRRRKPDPAQLVTRRSLPGGGTGPHQAVLIHLDLSNCYTALSRCENFYLVTAKLPPFSFENRGMENVAERAEAPGPGALEPTASFPGPPAKQMYTNIYVYMGVR